MTYINHQQKKDYMNQKIYANRNYLFSADMNINFMNCLSIGAYSMMFANVCYSVIKGDFIYSYSLHGAPNITVIKIFWVMCIAMQLVALFGILTGIYGGIRGKEGAQYYQPQSTGLGTYIKLSCMLFGFIFVLGWQLMIYIHQSQSIDKIIADSMFIPNIILIGAFGFGLTGFIRKVALHIKFNKLLRHTEL